MPSIPKTDALPLRHGSVSVLRNLLGGNLYCNALGGLFLSAFPDYPASAVVRNEFAVFALRKRLNLGSCFHFTRELDFLRIRSVSFQTHRLALA